MRTGVAESVKLEELNWRVFARQQIYRAGGAALPYALPWKRGFPEPGLPSALGVAVGVLAVGGAFGRRGARAPTPDDVGGAGAVRILLVGSLARQYRQRIARLRGGVLRRRPARAVRAWRSWARAGLWGERAVILAALAAVVIFAVSAFQIQTGQLAGDAENPEALKAEIADFDAVREITRGKVVAVLPDVFNPLDNIMDYYLAGSVLAKGEPTFAQMARADFVRQPTVGITAARVSPRSRPKTARYFSTPLRATYWISTAPSAAAWNPPNPPRAPASTCILKAIRSTTLKTRVRRIRRARQISLERPPRRRLRPAQSPPRYWTRQPKLRLHPTRDAGFRLRLHGESAAA